MVQRQHELEQAGEQIVHKYYSDVLSILQIDVTFFLQTLICLASCSLCLALPLADSAAEAEAIADPEAEAYYGAYGGFHHRTSARAGALMLD